MMGMTSPDEDAVDASLISHHNSKVLITQNDQIPKSNFHRKWRKFDDMCLKPFLIRDSAMRKQKKQKDEIDELLKLYNPLNGPEWN